MENFTFAAVMGTRELLGGVYVICQLRETATAPLQDGDLFDANTAPETSWSSSFMSSVHSCHHQR